MYAKLLYHEDNILNQTSDIFSCLLDQLSSENYKISVNLKLSDALGIVYTLQKGIFLVN